MAVGTEMPSVSATCFQVMRCGLSASRRTCPGVMLTRGLPRLIKQHLTVRDPDTLPACNG